MVTNNKIKRNRLKAMIKITTKTVNKINKKKNKNKIKERKKLLNRIQKVRVNTSEKK